MSESISTTAGSANWCSGSNEWLRDTSQESNATLWRGLARTLVAAEQLNLPWIGCDLSRKYCQVSMHRLELRTGPVFFS